VKSKMRKRTVFIKDGLFHFVAPEFTSEKYTVFDYDIVEMYTFEELEDACNALRIDFEEICGYSVWDAEQLSDDEQCEAHADIADAIKEAMDG